MNSKNDSDPPYSKMSPEQRKVASALGKDFVERIDQALLENCCDRNRKVARVVGTTMMDSELRVAGLPDLYYVERIKLLVNQGRLVAEGNLDYMRYSEVRLP